MERQTLLQAGEGGRGMDGLSSRKEVLETRDQAGWGLGGNL